MSSSICFCLVCLCLRPPLREERPFQPQPTSWDHKSLEAYPSALTTSAKNAKVPKNAGNRRCISMAVANVPCFQNLEINPGIGNIRTPGIISCLRFLRDPQENSKRTARVDHRSDFFVQNPTKSRSHHLLQEVNVWKKSTMAYMFTSDPKHLTKPISTITMFQHGCNTRRPFASTSPEAPRGNPAKASSNRKSVQSHKSNNKATVDIWRFVITCWDMCVYSAYFQKKNRSLNQFLNKNWFRHFD